VTIGTGGGACPISTGTHTIAVVADDANRITESNKNNNTFSQTIQVP
jgi:subtilase family serine protease